MTRQTHCEPALTGRSETQTLCRSPGNRNRAGNPRVTHHNRASESFLITCRVKFCKINLGSKHLPVNCNVLGSKAMRYLGKPEAHTQSRASHLSHVRHLPYRIRTRLRDKHSTFSLPEMFAPGSFPYITLTTPETSSSVPRHTKHSNPPTTVPGSGIPPGMDKTELTTIMLDDHDKAILIEEAVHTVFPNAKAPSRSSASRSSPPSRCPCRSLSKSLGWRRRYTPRPRHTADPHSRTRRSAWRAWSSTSSSKRSCRTTARSPCSPRSPARTATTMTTSRTRLGRASRSGPCRSAPRRARGYSWTTSHYTRPRGSSRPPPRSLQVLVTVTRIQIQREHLDARIQLQGLFVRLDAQRIIYLTNLLLSRLCQRGQYAPRPIPLACVAFHRLKCPMEIQNDVRGPPWVPACGGEGDSAPSCSWMPHFVYSSSSEKTPGSQLSLGAQIALSGVQEMLLQRYSYGEVVCGEEGQS